MRNAITQVNVDVTPKIRQGDAIYCEIDAGAGTPGRLVKGGVIKLPPGGSYQVNFQLQDGDVPGLQFDPNNPFSSDSNGCPTGLGNNGQFQPQIPAVGRN